MFEQVKFPAGRLMQSQDSPFKIENYLSIPKIVGLSIVSIKFASK